VNLASFLCFFQYLLRLNAILFMLAARHSSNALVLINIVVIRRATLVFGWVTILVLVIHLGVCSQLPSLAIPLYCQKIGCKQAHDTLVLYL